MGNPIAARSGAAGAIIPGIGRLWEVALVLGLGLFPLGAALAELPGWVIALVSVPALAGLHLIVTRRGGWRLISPHAYYDVLRMARRGRTTLVRVCFLLVMLGGIVYAYEQFGDLRSNISERNRLARFNAGCVFTWFLLQNLAILVFTPAYVGGAIAEERERGTLDLLFTTGLYDREIVLGKLVARALHLCGLLLAGLPVLTLMLFWGGVDMELLLLNWLNSVLLLLAASSWCLLVSTLPLRSTVCVSASYATVLLPAVCCTAFGAGFPLVLADTTGGPSQLAPNSPVTAALVYGLPSALFLFLATMALRPLDPPQPNLEELVAWLETRRQAAIAAGRPELPVPPLLGGSAAAWEIGPLADPLPPVHDHALLWKERFTGTRSLLTRPEILLMLIPPVAIAMLFVVGSISINLQNATSFLDGLRILSRTVGNPLRVLFGLCVACYAVGVAFRAAGSVVREKERAELDVLLMLPTDRSEILWAKALGALLKGWPWLALLAGNLIVGVALGTYHPVTAFCLLVCPWPIVMCLCTLGVLVSVVFRTSVQANLVMAGLLLVAVTCPFGLAFELLRGTTLLAFGLWDEPDDGWGAPLTVGFMLLTLVTCFLCAVLFWALARFFFERTGRR
jgi:ABC-type transport system involved in multi-copper enzyme maturation permease subunit